MGCKKPVKEEEEYQNTIPLFQYKYKLSSAV